MRLLSLCVAAVSLLNFTSVGAASYHVVDKIALPDGGWDLMSFDPALGRVYVAHGDKLTAYNPSDRTVIASLAPANHAHAAIPLKGGREILVTNGGDNTATFFDTKSGALIATLKTGEKPDAALFDAASGVVVVMNAKAGSLTLIDPNAHAVLSDIPVGGSLELGAALGDGRIAVNVEDKNEVAIVDLRALKVVKRIPLGGCEGPTGIAYLAMSKRVLSACANGVAAVSDPVAGRLVTTLPIGKGPDTALYDASRKLAFIPAGRSGELDVFADEVDGVRALGSTPTHEGARTGALDEATGRIYLVAADYDAPAAPGARPVVRSGSVVLVVVAP